MMNWEYIAGWCEWVAPIATTIAAIMTAANMGARVTGWGFVVFLVGSIHWTGLGIATGQTSLTAANGFLCIVNAVGIWRWLGVKARLDDGAQAAERKSEGTPTPTLLSLASVEGKRIYDVTGNIIGHIRGGMIEQETGRIRYVVIACGGIGGINDTLHSIAWDTLKPSNDGFEIPCSLDQLRAREQLDPADWPIAARAA
ncbi:MAG: PRC-barrel domain-containing protein [Sphingobium sp.]